jgi:hypothetical protein
MTIVLSLAILIGLLQAYSSIMNVRSGKVAGVYSPKEPTTEYIFFLNNLK